MNVPWQLFEKVLPTVNILVSVSLGFWLGYLRERRKAKCELEALARMLGSEVFFETVKMKESLSQLITLRKGLAAGDSNIRADHADSMVAMVYSANLTKIPGLPANLSTTLQIFHACLATAKSQSELLSRKFEAFHSRTANVTRDLVLEQIDSTRNACEAVVQVGQELIGMFKDTYPVQGPQFALEEGPEPGAVHMKVVRQGRS